MCESKLRAQQSSLTEQIHVRNAKWDNTTHTQTELLIVIFTFVTSEYVWQIFGFILEPFFKLNDDKQTHSLASGCLHVV